MTILRRFSWAAFSIPMLLGYCAGEARAQYGRGGYDPYNPKATSGGTGGSYYYYYVSPGYGGGMMPAMPMWNRGMMPYGMPSYSMPYTGGASYSVYYSGSGYGNQVTSGGYATSGYGRNSYEPSSYARRSYDPSSYATRSYDPGSYATRSYDPSSYANRSYDPSSFAPNGGSSAGGVVNDAAFSGSYGSQEPRSAFDRWVAQRDRARRPEMFQPELGEELIRSLQNPACGDIISGNALNSIVNGLAANEDRLKKTPPIALDEKLIAKLNFTRGAGSIGLLRDKGKLVWPAPIKNLPPAAESVKVREQIEKRFHDAFNQVDGGAKADESNIKVLRKQIDQLSDLVAAHTRKMTFADILLVKRYLKSLEDSVEFLNQPDASDWMPGKHKVKPKTVQELVQVMTEKKVRFAPSLIGNEAAYIAVHRMLAGLFAQANGPQVGMKR